MALSLAEKLKQAAAARLAETAPEINARLDNMDVQATTFQRPSSPSQTDAATPSDVPPRPQKNSADKLSRQTQQTNSTVELVCRTPQWNSADQQTNSADKLSRSADKLNRQTQQRNSADKLSRQIQKKTSTDKLSRQTQQTNPTGESSQNLLLPIRTRVRTPLTSRAQKILAVYLANNGEHVTTYAGITDETGIPYGTVRSALDKFIARGWVEKTPWGGGSNRALKFRPTAFLLEIAQDNSADKLGRQIQQTNSADDAVAHNGLPSLSAEFVCGVSPPLKIDRKNLSISQERVELTWPHLAATGFGSHQIEQIVLALQELGKPTDKLVQALDHAEWELEHGQMLDKTGGPVADPCSWVFRSLSKTGYYRQPKGYVSPEEQAIRDEADRLENIRRERTRLDEERFLAWKESLTTEEVKNVVQGYPGGNKDAWLKKVWRERTTKS